MSNIFDIQRSSQIDLRKSSSSSSSSSSSTTSSSQSRSMKEEEAMNWSLRNEAEREREVMWRAYIEFNIWINIRVNTFILSHRVLESKFVLTHSENQIFYICLRKFSCIYLLTSIFSCNYVVVLYLCIASHNSKESRILWWTRWCLSSTTNDKRKISFNKLKSHF